MGLFFEPAQSTLDCVCKRVLPNMSNRMLRIVSRQYERIQRYSMSVLREPPNIDCKILHPRGGLIDA